MAGSGYSRLDLVQSSAAVGQGRTHVRRTVADWDVSEDIADDVCLIASELLTNAMHHAQFPVGNLNPGCVPVWCCLLLLRSRWGLTVGVRDGDPAPLPRLSSPLQLHERGRGLVLVDHLSERWESTPVPPGKIVWARLHVPETEVLTQQRNLDAIPPLVLPGSGVMGA